MSTKTKQVRLYRIWCSVEECYRHAKYEADIDGPLLCGRHAHEIRAASRLRYLASLIARKEADR